MPMDHRPDSRAPRLARFTAMLALGAGAACLAPGCERFDPPPEVSLEAAVGDQWRPDSPLVLRFSEPIEPTSLAFAIWPHELDLEGEFLATSEPLVLACSPEAAGDCEDPESWTGCGAASVCLDPS